MTAPICPRCILVDANTVRLIPMPAECPRVWNCISCGGEFDYPPRTAAEGREPTFQEWREGTDELLEAARLRREGLVAVGDRLMSGRDRGLEDGSYETRKRGRWR